MALTPQTLPSWAGATGTPQRAWASASALSSPNKVQAGLWGEGSLEGAQLWTQASLLQPPVGSASRLLRKGRGSSWNLLHPAGSPPLGPGSQDRARQGWKRGSLCAVTPKLYPPRQEESPQCHRGNTC